MSAGLTTTAGILHALAKSPPKDDLARQELYDAARSLMYATESLIDTEHRLVFGVGGHLQPRKQKHKLINFLFRVRNLMSYGLSQI